MICPNPNCKAANPDNAFYCRKCGTKLTDSITPTPTTSTKTCPNCKKSNSIDADTCQYCGTSFKAKPMPNPATIRPGHLAIAVAAIIIAIFVGIAIIDNLNKPVTQEPIIIQKTDTVIRVETIPKTDTVRIVQPVVETPRENFYDLPADPSYDGYAWLSRHELTREEAYNYNHNQWDYMRNAIYARHGYIFTKPEYKKHFSQYSWYHPQFTDLDYVASQFNETENKNKNLLLRLSKER